MLAAVVAALAVAAVAAPAATAQQKVELTDAVGAFPPSLPAAKAWFAGTCDLTSPATEAGTPPPFPDGCLDFGEFVTPIGGSPNAPSPWDTLPAWKLAAVAGAGAHPDAEAGFAFDVVDTGVDDPVGNARHIVVDVPAGVVGNPQAVTQCTLEQFGAGPVECPSSSQVGVVRLRLRAGPVPATNFDPFYPVYNLEPRPGFTAEFGIPDIGNAAGSIAGTSLRLFAKARTAGDFGVTTGALSVPTQYGLIAQSLTFWGVPWAASHDRWRVPDPGLRDCLGGGSRLPPSGVPLECRSSYEPAWGPIQPFFTNPTECDGQKPVTTAWIDSYQATAGLVSTGSALPDGAPDAADPNWTTAGSEAVEVSECAKPPFDPSLDIEPTSPVADSATGIGVELDIPQNNDPPAAIASNPSDTTGAPAHWRSDAGRATSHLDQTVLTMPEGLSVNPSAATELRGCTEAQIGLTQPGNPPLFDNSDPLDGAGDDCPEQSILGTVSVETPLLEETLEGHLILGQPQPQDIRSAGEPLTTRLYIVVKSPERGLIAKVYGRTVTDPASGRLTTTFDQNPRVPFERLRVDVRGGSDGLLAMPQRCGGHAFSTTFSPWTATHGAGGSDVIDPGAITARSRCAFGHAPKLNAGMNGRIARGNGTFSFHFSREDGQQWFRGLTAELPTGLLASVRDFPLCTNAQADAHDCPAASRIGSVDAAAGSGTPFVLERKGDVYLTQGYKGGAYGLLVKVPVEAGPFRGNLALDPIVVRQAIHVDRTSAQVTAVSDPFPLIHHGVPLRVRDVIVRVDRPNFMLNPSDCSPKQVRAAILSAEGTRADVANHFQAANCADLRFEPRLRLALKGRRQVRTGKHPAIRAVVRQRGISEAGIAKAEVRLPKSLALDVDNAQALCEFDDGTKPDLENHCPKGSIVGRARAVTPLLDRPLVGNVYFVKNIRTDPRTGNQIRTLPMIIVALRGEIAVNLKGESSTSGDNKLVNTFASVPDAPVSRFNLNIKGGRDGIIAVTRTRRAQINLCKRPRRHVAQVDMDGQNGRRHDFDVRMRTPCRKRRPSAAKVCRKRTDSKPAFRRCVRKVKANRAKAAKRKAAKRAAARRGQRGGR
jgi:hypothetical protein